MLGPGAVEVPLKLKQTAGQRRIQAQGDIVEHQLPFDPHLQLAPVFLEYPNGGPAVDRQGEIDAESVEFWRRMLALEAGERTPAFLSTHPASERRIEALQRLLPSVASSGSVSRP
jgi:hypothetical protein